MAVSCRIMRIRFPHELAPGLERDRPLRAHRRAAAAGAGGAARGALGLALVVGFSLALFGPAVAVSSAFGAFQAAIATFQRSWRPRPTLALASGASLAASTFVGYLVGAHDGFFLALLLLWTFLAGSPGPPAPPPASSPPPTSR